MRPSSIEIAALSPAETQVDVGEVMPVRIFKEHGDQDSLKHADGGHGRIVWVELKLVTTSGSATQTGYG